MWYPDIQPVPKNSVSFSQHQHFTYCLARRNSITCLQFNWMQYDNNIIYSLVEESKLVVMCTLCSKDIEQNMNS